ncbi:hypothetical protein [Polaromonas sp.]|uniref:hypothetical protein n=1 Tax=Polaromonas sp. TaxID=1869339 RepID=UPI00286CB2DB|nr:hypothetical protein [Polaromonas sp.]
MAKLFKWLVLLALGLVLLLAAVFLTLQRWVGSEAFRQRVEREAAAVLAMPVTLDHVAVDLWPLPAVALSGMVVRSQPALTLGRVELRPQWQPLLQGRLVLATLLIRRAVLPQQGIDAVLLALQKKKQAVPVKSGPQPQSRVNPEPEALGLEGWPRRTVLDQATWVSNAGARTVLQGDIALADDGLPDQASLQLLKGNLQGLRATLTRQDKARSAAGADQWALRLAVGGGTVQGLLDVQRSALAISAVSSRSGPGGAELVLQGELKTEGVEVSALTAPDKLLSGRLQATTTLHARAASTGALMAALQTRSTLTLGKAVLHGLDLSQAVQTAGQGRGGQTALDRLSGQLSTQGRQLQLSQLVASAGDLSATGEVAVSPARALSGQLRVTLAALGQLAGTPVAEPLELELGGTLDDPRLTPARAALPGQAVRGLAGR